MTPSRFISHRSVALVWAITATVLLGSGGVARAQNSNEKRKAALNQEIKQLKKYLPEIESKMKDAMEKRDTQKKDIEALAADAKTSLEAMTAARTANNEARAAEAAAIAGLRRKAETEPGLAAAAASLKQAQEHFKAASDKALAPLKTTAPYKTAEAEIDKTNEAMKQLKEEPDSDVPGERARLANVLMASQKILSKMCDEAIVTDRDAADSRAKLNAAEAAMLAATKKVDEAGKNDPARVEAHQRAEEAGKAFKEAEQANAKVQAKYAAARNSGRELERAYQNLLRASNQTKEDIAAHEQAIKNIK